MVQKLKLYKDQKVSLHPFPTCSPSCRWTCFISWSILLLFHVNFFFFFCQNKPCMYLVFFPFLFFLHQRWHTQFLFTSMLWRSFRICTQARSAFLSLAVQVSVGWMQHSAVDQSLWKGSLALTNNFTRNILCICSLVCWAVSSEETPRYGIARLENQNRSDLFSIVTFPSAAVALCCIPPAVYASACFSTVVKLFDFCQFDR